MLATYTFGDVMWTMFVFFAWILFFWMLFGVFGDLFGRHDISGWAKAGWAVFVLFLPFLGVLVYLGVNGDGMAERRAKDVRQAQTQTDEYIRSVAGSGGAAAEIDRAKQLLDSGAIDAHEFATLKQRALAGP